MQITHGHAQRMVTLDAEARHLLRFVGGIVEHLNVEQFARIIEARNRVDKALDHVAFVVDRKLYGNLGPLRERRRRTGHVATMLGIGINQPVAMQPVGGKHHEHEEVRDHNGKIEGIELVETAKRVAKRIRLLGPIVRQRALRRHYQRDAVQAEQTGQLPVQNSVRAFVRSLAQLPRC